MKALLIKYGISLGLKKMKRGEFIVVWLPDGRSQSFNKTELRLINHKNELSFARLADQRGKEIIKKIKAGVELCFAVLVRNLQIRGHAGQELTESAAIKMLTKDGTDTRHFHSLIGIKRKSNRKVSLKQLKLLKRKKAVLLYSERHIAICSDGYYDDFGNAVELGDEIPMLWGRTAKGWFEIK